MTHPGKRLLVVGLVAMLFVGVAYSAAYAVMVRKQFSLLSSSTFFLGASPGTTLTIHAPYSSTTITSTTSLPASTFTPGGFFLKPRYTAVLGWPDDNVAEVTLGYFIHPIHWCDRQWLRPADWDYTSLIHFGTPSPFSWLSVKSVP
jgi:hypothetical protein